MVIKNCLNAVVLAGKGLVCIITETLFAKFSNNIGDESQKIDEISLMSRYGTVTGPLRDRYGTVTGVPLMLQISLLKSPRKTISVKIYRYGTVTGPLRDRYGTVTGPLRGHFRDFHAKKIPMCEHFLGLLS